MVEGIHVEDIFELVSLVLSLIIFLTFRILDHEEEQYTAFCLDSTQTDLSRASAFLVDFKLSWAMPSHFILLIYAL